jgi:hypothetical protein
MLTIDLVKAAFLDPSSADELEPKAEELPDDPIPTEDPGFERRPRGLCEQSKT